MERSFICRIKRKAISEYSFKQDKQKQIESTCEYSHHLISDLDSIMARHQLLKNAAL